MSGWLFDRRGAVLPRLGIEAGRAGDPSAYSISCGL